MHSANLSRGINSRLLVGDKQSDEESVVPFWGSRTFDYRPYQQPLINSLREVRRSITRSLGVDDFYHPYSHFPGPIAGLEPALLHLHNLHGGYFDLRALPELSRKYPIVWTLHDYWAFAGHCAYSLECSRWTVGCGQCPDLERAPQINRDATRYNFLRKRSLFSKTRLYVAAASEALLKRIPGSIVEPMVIESRRIPYGIDLKVFHPGDKEEARQRLGLPPDSFLILFAAYDAIRNPYKDFGTIRQAMEILQKKNPRRPVELAVLGASSEADQIGGLTIHPIGFVHSRETMADYYRAADLYLHSARDEVFGLVIVEAMACGVPVVATAVGGIPEVFGDGVEGILIPPADPPAMADAVLSILNSPEWSLQLGRAGTERARSKFDIERSHSEYLSWFEEILSTSGQPEGRLR